MNGTRTHTTEIPPFQVNDSPMITSPLGFKAAGIHSGIKKKRLDLGAIICEVPATAAAVYTMNAFQAAPLKVTQSSLEVEGKLQAIIVNSGNANACTGEQGLRDANLTRYKLAKLLEIPEHLVGVASTGVMGEFLPMDKIITGIDQLVLQVSKKDGDSFAESILTTDTCTKKVEVQLEVDGKQVKIAGVAKGSGMIHPNMATMLGFVTTDAVIESIQLQRLLWKATDESFNMITVDGDCSTNDMVIVMASGLAGHSPLTPKHKDWEKFQEAFTYVLRELAKMIARDGEGATRLIEAHVDGVISQEIANQVAKAIVGSNLVKTAIFGREANWGRILCAAGYTNPSLDPELVDLYLGEIPIVKNGTTVPYNEAAVNAILQQEKVRIHLSLHQGEYSATAWGCDLTYDYVKINASYRT